MCITLFKTKLCPKQKGKGGEMTPFMQPNFLIFPDTVPLSPDS